MRVQIETNVFITKCITFSEPMNQIETRDPKKTKVYQTQNLTTNVYNILNLKTNRKLDLELRDQKDIYL